MAIQLKINAQPRAEVGRNAVKKIKAAGFVPAVIYGAKDAAQNLQIVERELSQLLGHATSESVLVEVQCEGRRHEDRADPEVQHHPVSGAILHVDLHAVAMDELFTVEVSIETTGEPEGVTTGGGVLEVTLRTVEIECLPGDLPEAITVDVSKLQIGDSVHVRDLVLPKGVTVLNDAELTVAHVAAPTVVEEPAAPRTPPKARSRKSSARRSPKRARQPDFSAVRAAIRFRDFPWPPHPPTFRRSALWRVWAIPAANTRIPATTPDFWSSTGWRPGWAFPWRSRTLGKPFWGRAADGCTFLKPMTFMNASGRAVRACGGFYKIAAAETLIVYDDLALPLGQLRLRKDGSSGGQNGMQSVIEHLGTTAVPRLRVGIGATGEHRSMVDHVLGQFTKAEREALDGAIDRAADAVTTPGSTASRRR